MRTLIIAAVATAALSVTGPAMAQNARAERLHMTMPAGYKTLPLPPPPGRPNESIIILAPETPSKDAPQIWLSRKPMAAGATLDTIEADWAKKTGDGCTNLTVRPLSHGQENGYAFGEVVLICTNDKTSGQPRFEVDKTIIGDGQTYSLNYIFEHAYADADVQAALGWLNAQVVCNPTAIFHPCPKG